MPQAYCQSEKCGRSFTAASRNQKYCCLRCKQRCERERRALREAQLAPADDPVYAIRTWDDLRLIDTPRVAPNDSARDLLASMGLLPAAQAPTPTQEQQPLSDETTKPNDTTKP